MYMYPLFCMLYLYTLRQPNSASRSEIQNKALQKFNIDELLALIQPSTPKPERIQIENVYTPNHEEKVEA